MKEYECTDRVKIESSNEVTDPVALVCMDESTV